ncbi:hypothetical protein LguiB_013123 [Lonicera macranthoides]
MAETGLGLRSRWIGVAARVLFRWTILIGWILRMLNEMVADFIEPLVRKNSTIIWKAWVVEVDAGEFHCDRHHPYSMTAVLNGLPPRFAIMLTVQLGQTITPDAFNRAPPAIKGLCLHFLSHGAPELLDITRKFMNKPVRILMKPHELTLEGISNFLSMWKRQAGS